MAKKLNTLKREERALVLDTIAMLLEKGATAPEIVRRYEGLWSERQVYRLIEDAKKIGAELVPINSDKLRKELDRRSDDIVDLMVGMFSNEQRMGLANNILQYFKEDINRPILLAGDKLSLGDDKEITILPSDEIMMRKGRRDAIKDLKEMLKLDDLVERAIAVASPPPSNERFEELRKNLKL